MINDSQTLPDPFAQLRHDMRTPVNHIIGFSEILIEDAVAKDPSTLITDLQKIHTAAHHLLDLINAKPGAPSPTTASPQPSYTEVADPLFPMTGRILAVDDNPENLELLVRRLEHHGLDVAKTTNSLETLDILRSGAFDLVLLDVMMPVLDGYSVLLQIKADPTLRHIPVLMISALDEMESVARCIEAGAEDYLPKPLNPTLLRARLNACLEKKNLRDVEQRHLRVIEETQTRLKKELEEASAYMRSILPDPCTAPLRVDWKYQPSSELAGDTFGYHWIDADHFAIYLLDVCGHGVGAALLSATAINALRSDALPGVDFRNPDEVLFALNNAFQMERQNNLYFTIWYGVYHAPDRTLRYSTGGHPPALLISPKPDGTKSPTRLATPGMIIGVMEDVPYVSSECQIPVGATLFVLCDGCYEIRTPDGEVMEFDDFEDFMLENNGQTNTLDKLESWVHSKHGTGPLDDDFSIIQIQF